MQSQDSATPPSHSPEYDFILRDQPKLKRRLVPSLSGLPKPAKILLSVVAALLVVTIFGLIFSGGKGGSSQQLVSVMARGQEISRISLLVQPLTKNSSTLNLIATTNAVLASDQSQLKAYIKSSGGKFSQNSLSADINKTTDTQMQTAAQNNTIDSVYARYLKQNLNSYQSLIQSASKTASEKAIPMLNNILSSSQVLLTTPQLVGVSGP